MTDAMPDAGGPVLVAESGNRARQELGSALRAGGRPVIEVADVAGCLAAAGLPDLAAVVLALDLPGRLGPVALVGAVRDRCRGARLVVAVLDTDVGGGTAALAAGADDWVAKPFRPGEVERRLQLVPRPSPGDRPAAGPVVRWADLELDRHHRVLRRGGQDVALTPHELGLLEVLAANPGRLLSHEALLKAVWGPAYGTESAYLRTFMSQLRRKLGDDAQAPTMIRTEPGLGYRWIAAVAGR